MLSLVGCRLYIGMHLRDELLKWLDFLYRKKPAHLSTEEPVLGILVALNNLKNERYFQQ